MNSIEIFKTGKHTDANGQSVEMTLTDLQNIAKDYQKDLHEAPVVIGHPQAQAPAYAWVDSLFTKDNSLYANFAQVDDDFKELVNNGRFKKLSASFYKPNSSINPSPTKQWYLRHVGFLGAMPPAIKGLKQVSFNEVEEFASFDLNEAEDFSAPSQASEQAETSANKEDLTKPNPTNNGDKPTMTIEEMQAKLAESEQIIAKLEAERALAQNQAKVNENVAFAETLLNEGKVAPAFKNTVVNVLNALTGLETADFSEDKADLNAVKTGFKDYLNKLPKSNLDRELIAPATSVDFAEADFNDSQILNEKVKALATAQSISYEQALNKVIAGDI